MNHTSPASFPEPTAFPDPMQRIGTPVPVPHGQKPNPVYQDLLTLYAKVYGAEEGLSRALHPARRTADEGKAWQGQAARTWTTELNDWNRRLGHTSEAILHELAGQLRNTPPFVPIGTPEPMQPGRPHSNPLVPTPVTVGMPPGTNPGGTMHQGGTDPGGAMHHEPNPGGTMHQGGTDPGGAMHHEPNPGGTMHQGGPNPGGAMHHERNPGGIMHQEPNPGGAMSSGGTDPGGMMHHERNPGGIMHQEPNPGGVAQPGSDPGGHRESEPTITE